jgi:aryl-alcohol dehydrogenase-like predicted oxidoreductase
LQEREIRREELVVVTKGGCNGQEKLWSANISEDAIRADIINSRDRLGLQHLDLFMLHRDDPAVDVCVVVDMMDQFQREGLVTAWGVSNWELHRLQAALQYAKTEGKAHPVCDSMQFSLAQPTRSVWPDTQYMRPESREWYAKTGTAVLAWECLAKGFMAGKVSLKGGWCRWHPHSCLPVGAVYSARAFTHLMVVVRAHPPPPYTHTHTHTHTF